MYHPQRSIVILSHLAYPALFDAVLEKVAPIYFSHGYPALEAACHGIAGWYVGRYADLVRNSFYAVPVLIRPDPVPGETLELPLLSDMLRVKLPDLNEAPQMQSKRANRAPQEAPLVRLMHKRSEVNMLTLILPPPSKILASLPTVAPLRVFADLLPSLWHIWECLVLGEPLLVIAPDPRTCSHLVWWMRDLIRPVCRHLQKRPTAKI